MQLFFEIYGVGSDGLWATEVFKSAASPQPSPPSEMEERERTRGALYGKRTLPVLFAQQLAGHVTAKGSLHSKVPWQSKRRLLLRWRLRLGFATAALRSRFGGGLLPRLQHFIGGEGGGGFCVFLALAGAAGEFQA